MTLAEPLNVGTLIPIPSYKLMLTSLHLAVAGTETTTMQGAFANTWSKFAGPANVRTWDNRPLYYYKPGEGFTACALTPFGNLMNNGTAVQPGLLVNSTGSGQCGSFAYLLQFALASNGIGSQFVSITPLNAQEDMLINVWGGFETNPGTFPTESTYKWRVLVNSGDPMVNADGTARTDFGDITNELGLPGQNTTTPSEKIFGRHFIVKVDPSISLTPYFDPSYGAQYMNALDFQSQAVKAYAISLINDNTNPAALEQFLRARKPNPALAFVKLEP